MPPIKEIQKKLITTAQEKYHTAIVWEEGLGEFEGIMSEYLTGRYKTMTRTGEVHAQHIIREIASGELPINLYFVTKRGGDRTVVLPLPEIYDEKGQRIFIVKNFVELAPRVKDVCTRISSWVRIGRPETMFGANIQVVWKNSANKRDLPLSMGDLHDTVIDNDPVTFSGYREIFTRVAESLAVPTHL